jgi:hypothetical protein
MADGIEIIQREPGSWDFELCRQGCDKVRIQALMAGIRKRVIGARILVVTQLRALARLAWDAIQVSVLPGKGHHARDCEQEAQSPKEAVQSLHTDRHIIQ